ncbi:MAG: TonB-dependent receptor, partial [Bacteroidota bacterium]
MKQTILFFVLLVFSTSQVLGQDDSEIVGKAFGPDGGPLDFANILLHQANDSSVLKLALSDEEGNYRFEAIPADRYWIEVSYVGMPSAHSEVFEVQANSTFTATDIRVEAATNELTAVTVKASRPLLEMKPGKMVFNVEGSNNTVGSDAMELLRKAPGVVVDNNDNITLLGKSGVRIYIDGKPSPLGNADLAALLKSMQASEIDAIEIISNPSAKYDAEGSGGIINIKLKKDKKLGANANLNTSIAQGWTRQYNAAISSNYRSKKVNVFANYSYFNGDNRNPLRIYREQFGTAFSQKGESNSNWESQNFKVGADYYLNKKSTIGVLVNGNLSNFTNSNEARTSIVNLGDGLTNRVLLANTDSDGRRSNANFNVNYRFDDGKGVSWNVDADYGRFENRTDMNQPNLYYNADLTKVLQERTYSNYAPTDINIYTFKIDHERPLLKGVFGAG